MNSEQSAQSSKGLPVMLTFAQFAEYFGVCIATARRMAKRGEIKTIAVNSRLIRIPRSEVERIEKEWLA